MSSNFNMGGRVQVYTTPDGRISFYPNLRGWSGAYDVIIARRDHFYIASGTLDDLTNPTTSTESSMEMLANIYGSELQYKLSANNIKTYELHIALLQLRIKEQEEEIREAYSPKPMG